MTIGQRIGELRRSYGYSQEYIAEQLNVSRQAVSKWEQDISAPDTYNLIALAELLQVSVEYLATGKQPPAPIAPEPPPAPPHRTIGIPHIAGMILLGAGLLSLILGILLSEVLLVLAVLMLLVGTLCLTVRRHLGLVLLWLALVLIFLIVAVLMPLRSAPVTDMGDGVAMAQRRSPLPLAASAATLVLAVLAIIHRIRRRK